MTRSKVPETVRIPDSSIRKYQLRPRSAHARRLYLDSDLSCGDFTRPKLRCPPLSRLRRKTANARERYRMRQINKAFENLRGVLPKWLCSRPADAELTKIATLRLASTYIQSLQHILDSNSPEDTLPWGLTSMLDAPLSPPKDIPVNPLSHNLQQVQTDFVGILTGSSSTHQVLNHSFESFCYTAPPGLNEEFYLRFETPTASNEA